MNFVKNTRFGGGLALKVIKLRILLCQCNNRMIRMVVMINKMKINKIRRYKIREMR